MAKEKAKKKRLSRLDNLNRRVFEVSEKAAKNEEHIGILYWFNDDLRKFVVKAIIIGIIAILVLGASIVIHKHSITKDYCIEWDGWIERDNLFLSCFDFTDNGMDCIWNFKEDGDLEITRFVDKKITTYPCSRYVASTGVENGEGKSIAGFKIYQDQSRGQ